VKAWLEGEGGYSIPNNFYLNGQGKNCAKRGRGGVWKILSEHGPIFLAGRARKVWT